MIRLATAHAKLRLATQIEVSDIDLASKLLHLTIFNEPWEKEGEADQEMQEEEEEDVGAAAQQQDEGIVPLKQ